MPPFCAVLESITQKPQKKRTEKGSPPKLYTVGNVDDVDNFSNLRKPHKYRVFEGIEAGIYPQENCG